MDTWQAIRVEREALVGALDRLRSEDWDKPSLCAGWSVREVVAHLVATAQMTPPRFFGKFIGSGFNFGKMVRSDIAALTEAHGDADLTGLLRDRVATRNSPPGPTASWLGETIVHGEDVTRALGGYRAHPVEHLVAVADFYKNSNALIGTKNRIAGVSLSATDADWSHGSGPAISGPMIALVMAMTGRAAALDDLTGEGVGVLRSRR